MSVTIATYLTFVRYAGKSLEVAMGRKKPGVAVAKTSADYAQALSGEKASSEGRDGWESMPSEVRTGVPPPG